MKITKEIRSIIDYGMMLEHQYDIEQVLSMVKDECDVHHFTERRTQQITESVRRRITELQDFRAGIRDCKNGIYDKWYRYNRKDDGVAYDRGWMRQNKTTMVEYVEFI